MEDGQRHVSFHLSGALYDKLLCVGDPSKQLNMLLLEQSKGKDGALSISAHSVRTGSETKRSKWTTSLSAEHYATSMIYPSLWNVFSARQMDSK
jgi:hypothetical protein